MQTMLIEKITKPFFNQFFSENTVKNDVFVIEVNQKFFFFESDTVIDMIKKFPLDQQEDIKYQLCLCKFLNRDINTYLEEIATDYVKKCYESK